MQRLSEGTAAAQAKTLVGALGLLKNAIGNLLSAVGAPFLGFLTDIVNSIALIINKAAEGVRALENLFNSVPRWIKNLIGFGEAAEISSETMDVFQRKIREMKVASEGFDQVLEKITSRMKLLSSLAQADIFGKAIKSLSAPGIGETDIKGILAGQEEAVAASDARIAEEKATTLEGILAHDKMMIERSLHAEQVLRTIGTKLSIAQAEELAAARIELENKVQKKIGPEAAAARKDANEKLFSIDKAAAEDLAKAQIEAAKQAIQDRLLVTKAGIETEKTLRKAEGDALTAIAKAELESFKKTEEVRIQILRGIVERLNEAERAGLDARGTLIDVETQIAQSKLQQRIDQQNVLRQQGFLDEQTAARENAAVQNKIDQDALRRQIELAKDRLAQAKIAAQRETLLAQDTFDSKVGQIEAEHQFKVDELKSSAELKKADLDTTVALARAETEAKIAELKAQHDAAQAERRAKIDEDEAAGKITADAAAKRRAALAVAEQSFQNQIGAIQAADATRFTAVQKQKGFIDDTVKAQVLASEKEQNAEIAAARDELQSNLQRIATGDVKAQGDALKDLTGLRTKAVSDEQKARERLAALGILSPGQIDDLLKPYDSLINQIDTASGKLQGDLRKATKGLADDTAQVAGQWQIVFETVGGVQRRISEMFGSKATGVISAAAAGAGAGATAGIGGPVIQSVSNTFNVTGARVSLSTDEQATLQRIMGMLLGPEGNRILEQYMKSTQGGIADRSPSSLP
jgi:hypothetical protein